MNKVEGREGGGETDDDDDGGKEEEGRKGREQNEWTSSFPFLFFHFLLCFVSTLSFSTLVL